MKVLAQLKGEDTWQEITLEECLLKTEEAGFYTPGTVEQLLENGSAVDTPWSIFKKAI
ncbi:MULTISPECIES: hypothetical protein [unclassified Desulfosporosinus]|uniref:hypothetical protein n=1 Tax=unclassified Desulfosporosinus TaxID=2633794 RepID=UPI000223AB34|nr:MULTISPECIES: hypothetical protein [unclassified Desulfosporosinus]EGW36342.1 hypothetical protein DOT_5848 [Desulfosporosinus sp. OT]ODA40516.1 hypothetical protein DSBG_2727 [Desulfosporosinus sp. BG]